MASPHFYPTYGGAQNRYRQYIPGFMQRGLDVRLLTGTPLPDERSELDAELGWYELEPGERTPPSLLDGAPLERIRLPDNKSSQRTSIFYGGASSTLLMVMLSDPHILFDDFISSNSLSRSWNSRFFLNVSACVIINDEFILRR